VARGSRGDSLRGVPRCREQPAPARRLSGFRRSGHLPQLAAAEAGASVVSHIPSTIRFLQNASRDLRVYWHSAISWWRRCLKPASAQPLFSDAHVESSNDIYRALAGHLGWRQLQEVQRGLARQGVQLSLLDPNSFASGLMAIYDDVKQRQLL